jgi:hypothetical protein
MPPPEVAMINLELKAALSGFQENEEVYPQFNPHVTLFRISPASNLCATNLLQALSNPAHVLNEQPILPVKQAISIDNIRLIESNDGYTVI